MDEKDKKEYELAVLIPTEEGLASVTALIRQHNGEMSAEPRAKKIALAYEIKKHKEAVFAYCSFKALPEEAKNLESALNTSATVIRSLMIASPAPSEPIERQPVPSGIVKRRTRTMHAETPGDAKPAASKPLSNEALEKKIEEILQ